MQSYEIKPGQHIINTKHPEWGIFTVLRKYDERTWEIRGQRGDRILDESEALREWAPEQKESIRPRHCFYVPGDTNIIDTATNGKGSCTGETLEQINKRYPGVKLMDFDTAIAECETAKERKYNIGKAFPSDKEAFTYALEVLPPCHWKNDGDTESFQVSERISGTITDAHIRIGSNYYHAHVHIGTPHNEIIQMVHDLWSRE